MLHRPMMRTLFAGVACLGLAEATRADILDETGYLPTSYVVPSASSTSYLPTAYFPTSYQPTSYLPTSYVPTSYLPTSYLPTSTVLATESYAYPTSTTIVRRSFFRPRRFIERTFRYGLPSASYVSPTSYLASSYLTPTSYYVPTTYYAGSSLLPTSYLSSYAVAPTSYVIDRGVVTTSLSSSDPCETTSAPVQARSTVIRPSNPSNGEPGNAIVSVPSNVSNANERRPQGTVSSVPGNEEPAPLNVNTAPAKEVPPPAMVPTAKPDPTPPAQQPLPELNPNDIKIPEAGRSGAVNPQPSETSFRSSRRPTYDGRNILRGRVVSAESRRPEEGVSVIIANLTKNYADRNAMTDADGEFKVSLPDGDWTVKVQMPSGSIFAVGRDFVTASNGRVTDASGRNVAEFLITR